MLHRVKKKNDINKDKWIGIGGKFEGEESPEECLLREAREETGLNLTSWRCRGVVTFLQEGTVGEYMYLFTADGFTGELKECDEGELQWVSREFLDQLPKWEGDDIFLDLLWQDAPFFLLTLRYRGDKLLEAVLDGKKSGKPGAFWGKLLLFTGTSVTIFLKTWEIGMEVNRMRKTMAWLLIGVILLLAGCATQVEEQAASTEESFVLLEVSKEDAPRFSYEEDMELYLSEDVEFAGDIRFRQEGFHNIISCEINTTVEAAERAELEYPRDHDMTAVFYDPDADVWMVAFSMMGEHQVQDVVYLDAEGRTLAMISW